MNELDDELATACRVLGAFGHGDSVFGHVSARSATAGEHLIKGAGVGLEEVRPDDVIVVDRAGKVVRGARPCHAEVWIHLGLYAARSDIGAVVHTHPPYGVMMSAREGPVRSIGHEGAFFSPAGVRRFDETSALVNTRELGDAVAESMADAPALLLRNHGIVTVGRDVREATIAALLLEKACFLQVSLGDSAYRSASPDEEERKRSEIYTASSIEAMWTYYCRRLRQPT